MQAFPVRFFLPFFLLLLASCTASRPVTYQGVPVDDAYAATVAQRLHEAETYGVAVIDAAKIAYTHNMLSVRQARALIDASDLAVVGIESARQVLAAYLDGRASRSDLDGAVLVVRSALEVLLRLAQEASL